MSEKYEGAEYITGKTVKISGGDTYKMTFTAEWPGNYRFELSVSGDDVNEKITIDVPVELRQSP